MKTPHLELGSRGSRVVAWGHGTSRAQRRLIGLSVLIGAAACVAVLVWGVSQRGQLMDLQDQLAERAARRAAPLEASASAPAMPTMTAARLDAWNAVVRQLNTAWPAVFDLLERRTPTTVALLSVEPEARRLRLRITAEARTLADLLDFAQALREDDQVSEVALVRHDTDEQNPQQPVRLTLDVALTAPAPVAAAASDVTAAAPAVRSSADKPAAPTVSDKASAPSRSLRASGARS
ncbi:PilN domain-containing protein [Roseateles amylovorans]|uniref:PilN domain-containing protein n=1 Tax=Roseateles amylovorans TaxID=2978473 RepID=A0ABY6AS46_9BURK|nr:PilN domain-containing protein [Roseateles amylovorans]UXH76061.1 PilN domain-containing protein [Roseateles amylovorans]